MTHNTLDDITKQFLTGTEQSLTLLFPNVELFVSENMAYSGKICGTGATKKAGKTQGRTGFCVGLFDDINLQLN